MKLTGTMTHSLRQLAKLPIFLILLSALSYHAAGQTDVQNPEFDDAMSNWSFKDQSGANNSYGGGSATVVQGAGLSGTNSLYIDVANTNNDSWTLRVRQSLNFDFEVGKTYKISFVAKAQTPRDMDVAIAGTGSNNNYWYLDLSLGTAPQAYSFYFDCTDPDVLNEPSFILSFYLAKGVISDVWLDKISVEDVTGRVTSVEVAPTYVVIMPEQTWQLDAQVFPLDAINQNVSWSSSDVNIATVSSTGVVTAISPGVCVVTATSEDGGFSASTIVQVPTLGETVVQNAEFDQGTSSWSFRDYTGPNQSHGGSGFSIVTDAGMSGATALRVDVVNNNADAWTLAVRQQQLSFRLMEGRRYRVRFLAKAESARELDWSFSGNTSQLNYWYQSADLTPSSQLFSYEFYCTDSDVENESSFSLNFYLAQGVVSDVWLDQISVEDITGLVTGVVAFPSKVVLLSGQTWQLDKSIEPFDAVNQNVTWASSNTNVATVSNTGLVTAVSPGSATISVTTVDGGYVSLVAVTVPAPGTTPLTNGEFDLGTSGWILKDKSGAGYTDGGTTYSVVQGAGMSGTNALLVDIVNDNPTPWHLRVTSPLDFRLELGKTYRVSFKAKAQSNRELHATIYGEGSQVNYFYAGMDLTSTPQDYSFTFTCNNSGILSEPSFSFGFFLALGEISDVWIDKATIENITGKVTSIAVTPSVLTLKQEQNWQLNSAITPSDAINQNITWSSSNTSIAEVSNTGLVTGISFGTATITATSADGGYTSTSTVTVAATGITTIQNPEFDLGLTGWTLKDRTGPGYTDGGTGYSVVQGAGMSGNNALYVDIVNTNNSNWHLQLIQPLTFRIEYGKTYRISFMVKAESARDMHAVLVGEGTQIGYSYGDFDATTSVQTITYNYTCNNSGVNSEPSFALKFYLAQGVISDLWIDKVSVQDITSVISVTGISVLPSALTLTAGQTSQLTKTITPSNATNQDVNWASSNDAVATVNGLGLVTAISAGSATITATAVNGGFTDQSEITVQELQLTSGQNIAWNNLLGVNDDDTYILTKTAEAGWSNAGGVSENQLPAAQNGWFEFKIDNPNTTSNYVIGFSTVDNSYLRTSVEYGLEVSPSGNRILLHESSDAGTDLSAWAVGDVFRISREESVIKYYRNGIELRSVATDPTKAFKIKALINEGKTHSTTASFWIPSSRGQVPDAWEFAALKDLYNSTNGASWTNKTSWGSPNNWATNITAAQMNAWFGITTSGGDITRVVLQSNNLNGQIPESISKLKALRWLYLDHNGLQGSIPTSIGTVTLLDRLFLNNNSLTGDIPSSMGNLTRMQYLILEYNNLTGNLDWVGSLVNIIHLYIRNNPNLDCTIPSSIGNLTKMMVFVAGGFLADRDYVQMKMHGPIPSTIANCIKLEWLYLDNSEFTGTVPDLSNIPNLRVISLFNNPSLGGDVSAIAASRTTLTNLYTFNTNIGGSLPVINSNAIIGLDFSNSPARGTVPNPPNTNTVQWLGFQTLELESTPDWGTSYSKLWYLNVSNNLLTSIPDFSNHPNKANLELYIDGNELDFTDIEPNFTAAGAHPFKIFVYAPQRNPMPAPPYITVMVGQEIKIEAPSGGVHGVYLWEKKVDGTWTNVNMLNQSGTPHHFIRSNGTESDEGTYRYTVTNTWVPGLTFQSGEIQVAIGDAHASSAKALYNGTITAMRWRTDKAYGVEGATDFEGMYVFDYDEKYQIKDASWATPGIEDVDLDNTFRLTGMKYDPNGNILALKRYDENQNRIHNFNYQYDDRDASQQRLYNNKLTSVAGYVDKYEYNNLGQLTEEEKENGDKQYVIYDVSGKVRKVYANKNSSGEFIDIKVEYLYDDRGFRTAKLNFEDNRTTWYIRDASGNVISIYEQPGVDGQTPASIQDPVVETTAPLTPTEMPVYGSGKVGTYYPSQDGSMSYEITDHLGNVRALVRDDIMVFTATMEDNGDPEDKANPRYSEKTFFQNIEETEKDDPNMNYTPDNATVVSSPSRSAYLFWQNGVPGIEAADKATGPAIALEVKEGDILTANAFARYENKTGGYPRNGVTLSVLASLLGNSFSTMAGFEGKPLAEVNQLVNNALAAGAFLDEEDDGVPFAYVNYIIFDAQMQRIDSKRQRVSENAGFDPPEAALDDQHEEVKFLEDIVIGSGAKYIYLWVNNESEDTKVWFDDFTVTHTSNFVAQATDYGVWGDVLREQRSEWQDRYRFGYQGQFAEKDEETGWSHFELREYDPVIGRWTAPDPYGQYWSPYLGLGNDPVDNVDPDGGFICPDCPDGVEYDDYKNSNLFYNYSPSASGDGVYQALPDLEFQYYYNIKPAMFMLADFMTTFISVMDGAYALEGIVAASRATAGLYSAARYEATQAAKLAAEQAPKAVRNANLAGKVHPKTGVPFDKSGFPNFSKNLYKGGVNDVMIKPTGNRVTDFAAANQAAGYSSTPKGHTWHHHQTTGRMQLVETGVHSQTGHTGGFSLWE